MAQYYHTPMWKVPDLVPNHVESQHINTLRGSSSKYRETGPAYKSFANDLIYRISLLGDS